MLLFAYKYGCHYIINDDNVSAYLLNQFSAPVIRRLFIILRLASTESAGFEWLSRASTRPSHDADEPPPTCHLHDDAW